MNVPNRIHILVGVCTLALAFAAGRFSTPTKTVETTKTVEVESTASKTEIASLKNELAQTKRHTVKETRVVYRDGQRVEVIRKEDTHVDTSTEIRIAETEKADTKTETKKATESARAVESKRPDWFLAPLVAVDVRTGAVAYGGLVGRRILGPVSVGVFGLSSGHAGAFVGVSF